MCVYVHIYINNYKFLLVNFFVIVSMECVCVCVCVICMSVVVHMDLI